MDGCDEEEYQPVLMPGSVIVRLVETASAFNLGVHGRRPRARDLEQQRAIQSAIPDLHARAELECITDAGIETLCKRLFAGDFAHKDSCKTIRLETWAGAADKGAVGLLCRCQG